MNKIEVLRRLRAAKRSHLHWISNAHGLVDGMPVNPKSVPIAPTQTGFGQWYYGEGQNLSDFETFNQIAPHHRKMHDIFRQISLYLQGNAEVKKTPVWKSIIGKSNHDQFLQPEKAQQLYPSLKESSDEVIKLLRALEEQINNLP